MKRINMTNLRNAFRDQSGQVLPWVAVAMTAMLGMAGLTIDAGRAYVVRSQLQNSTNAAALAAAGNVYNSSSTTNATTVAQQYSSQSSGNENYQSSLGTVTTTITTKCLTMLLPAGTTSCTGAPDNAVVVKQSASVPTSFMRLFGFKTLTVQTVATASMQGMAQPWNVAIIIDSTGSMNTVDGNCGGSTEFQCALQGVQALLAATNPACPPGSSQCPTGANFQVSLFTFPNVSLATAHMDTDCSGHPTAMPYTLPVPGATLPVDATTGLQYLTYKQTSSGTTWNATYQITPFLSDYYAPTNKSTGGLNPSSKLVGAVGYGGASGTAGCLTYAQGIVNSGMGNTYFAGAIYAAQSALLAQQAANPLSKNAIIYLSDGQANLFLNQFPNNPSANTSVGCNAGTYSGTEYSLSSCGTSTASQTGAVYLTPATIASTSSTGTALGYDTLSSSAALTQAQIRAGQTQSRSGSTRGIYPDWYDQCQQAVMAARYAATYPNNPTTVYGVAYGAESGGCTNGWNLGLTDTTAATSGTLNVAVNIPGMIPCTTVEDIASSLQNFYSDYNQSGGSVDKNCVDGLHTVTSLSQIFQSIAASFTTPRLLPNNAQ
jgi:Flp pilus assembly protein TadG